MSVSECNRWKEISQIGFTDSCCGDYVESITYLLTLSILRCETSKFIVYIVSLSLQIFGPVAEGSSAKATDYVATGQETPLKYVPVIIRSIYDL